MAEITLVAAIARNNVIGAAGGMPWQIPTDLAHFRNITLGHPIIMGRKTYEAIGRPLDGRTNFIVSARHRQSDDRPAGGRFLPVSSGGVYWRSSPDEALASASEEIKQGAASPVMVIGGAEIFQWFMGRAQYLEITHIDLSPAGDAYFPTINPVQWAETRRTDPIQNLQDSARHYFASYRRRA